MRRARTLALVAILVAFATQDVAPALADGGFYGVHDASSHFSHRDLDRMDHGHVGVVRRLLYWPAVEPRKGKFEWAGLDRAVGSLASRGIATLPVVFGSPRYIARDPGVPPVHGAKKRKLWRKFLAAVVKRYGTGGTYWTMPGLYPQQHPGKRALPIQDWQIWNEPNLKKFFPPHPSVSRYATLVKNAHRAIASVDPNANLVLAGMSGRGQPSDKKFLDRFYAIRQIQASFEAVAVNPYAPRVAQVGRKIRRIRGVMRRHGDGQTPIWITELGWGSHPPDRFGLNKGPKGQKRMLQKSFRLIVHHRRAWHVKRLIWFDFRDPPANRGGCSFCSSAGLLKHGGKSKPAWRAFKRFTH